jgi:hypothetical protein
MSQNDDRRGQWSFQHRPHPPPLWMNLIWRLDRVLCLHFTCQMGTFWIFQVNTNRCPSATFSAFLTPCGSDMQVWRTHRGGGLGIKAGWLGKAKMSQVWLRQDITFLKVPKQSKQVEVGGTGMPCGQPRSRGPFKGPRPGICLAQACHNSSERDEGVSLVICMPSLWGGEAAAGKTEQSESGEEQGKASSSGWKGLR